MGIMIDRGSPPPQNAYSTSMLRELMFKYAKMGGYSGVKEDLHIDLANALNGASGKSNMISYENFENFPKKGKDGIFYVDAETKTIYIWSNNTYKVIGGELVWETMED